MLKFKDIVRYICATVIYLYKCIKKLLKMDSVYDCARPFMLFAGIFGIGGSLFREIDGIRSVRNTKLSLIIATLISLIITPARIIWYFYRVFSGFQQSLTDNTTMILLFGQYIFTLIPTTVTCIRTHVYCKNLTKILQILHNTDMLLKRENIKINHWKIVLKTILFSLISCNQYDIRATVFGILNLAITPVLTAYFIAQLFIEITREIYFMWMILFLLVIRERFVGLNKLLLQNAQLPSIEQDDTLLRRISLARDIHEQLSEAIELFSEISRFIIIGLLVPGMLRSIYNAVLVTKLWTGILSTIEEYDEILIYALLFYSYIVVYPIIKIIILTAVCEGHKNNRLALTARLRYLIAREEDPAIVQQLKQYIWFIYDTPAGLVDFQLVDVDFTLLFTVIDIIIQYLFVVYSYVRESKQGETM